MGPSSVPTVLEAWPRHLTHCVTPSRLPNFSVPQFHYLPSEDNYGNNHQGLLRAGELIYTKHLELNLVHCNCSTNVNCCSY